jgi:hypothetical protein
MAGERRPTSTPLIDQLAMTLASGSRTLTSRRKFGVMALAAVASAAKTPSRPARARTTVEAVLDDTSAAEALMVTFLAVARTKASNLALDDTMVRMIRSAQCEDGAHVDNLIARGGSPSHTTFTVSDEIFANTTNFLSTWLDLVTIMAGMYMAAARQAADAGQLDLVEVMYQIGTVESQHLALLRLAAGERIPADRAFPSWQFDAVQDALAALQRRGFIDGTGTTYDYPGPGERYCRGVTGLVSETTSDQTEPDVTAAPPAPDASPVASPASN